MPYITIKKQKMPHQLTFEEVMTGFFDKIENEKDTKETYTWHRDSVPDELLRKTDFRGMYYVIKNFNEKYKNLIDTEDKRTLYYSFKIPKRSGGLRQIDAPNQELMQALKELSNILEQNFYFTHHTTAFAYVRGRSTIDAVKRHQSNHSRWILKTDLSKFFPNTTPDWMFSMLYQTYPLCSFSENMEYRLEFEKAMSLCFLNGGLPQGTPTSPMLTNQMMIPMDYEINKMCHHYSPHLCYTRYADDMDFSSEYDFEWKDVVKKVGEIMKSFRSPFQFNSEKCHFGSTAGKNWMLGVMLNKDNKITVGHENKKTFKTSLFAFGNSVKDGKPWGLEDTMHLQGIMSYYIMVEGDCIKEIVNKYSQKFGFDLIEAMKKVIRESTI